MPDAAALQAALGRIHPRSMQVLLARCAPGVTHAAFAGRYGVDEAAAAVLLWRAARELEAAVFGTKPPGPAPFDAEGRAAQALRTALDATWPEPGGTANDSRAQAVPRSVSAPSGDAPAAPRAHPSVGSAGEATRRPGDGLASAVRGSTEAPAPGPLAPLLASLRSQHAAVVEAVARAEAAHEQSPAARRATWLRRAAIAVIVALSAYFLWRDHQLPEPPRFEPRTAPQPR